MILTFTVWSTADFLSIEYKNVYVKHCICQNQACKECILSFFQDFFSNFPKLTQDCLDHSSWFKHKSTSFCSAHGIGVIVLPKLRVWKTRHFRHIRLLGSVKEAILLLHCIICACSEPLTPHPVVHDCAAMPPLHTCGIICAHSHVTISMMTLLISLGFLTKSDQWRDTSALRSCSIRTSSHLLVNNVTIPQHGLDYSVTTPLSTSRTFDICSLYMYMHITLSFKKMIPTSIKSI